VGSSSNRYALRFQAYLTLFVKSVLSSDTAEQVKRKEQLFRRRFMPVLARFAAVGDLWCSSVLGIGSAPLAPKRYADVVSALDSRRQFQAVLNAEWAQDRLGALRMSGTRCFHWEFAFPEVFLDNGGNGRARGFDVIVGNPPYDVIAERESGERVALVRRFVEQDPTLQPSRVGKNNLYKIFICRALELVRDGGYLGFIVPMALLGDEQVFGVRRALVSYGVFLEIHAFPQKDDPVRRVFYDAKLSTALFVYQKQLQADEDYRFVSAVHPAQFIEVSSPCLRPMTSDIESYDPIT
jgi:hypothetical protein